MIEKATAKPVHRKGREVLTGMKKSESAMTAISRDDGEAWGELKDYTFEINIR